MPLQCSTDCSIQIPVQWSSFVAQSASPQALMVALQSKNFWQLISPCRVLSAAALVLGLIHQPFLLPEKLCWGVAVLSLCGGDVFLAGFKWGKEQSWWERRSRAGIQQEQPTAVLGVGNDDAQHSWWHCWLKWDQKIKQSLGQGRGSQFKSEAHKAERAGHLSKNV